MHRYKWHTILFLIFLVIVQPNLTKWFSVKGAGVSFVLFFIMMAAFGIRKPDIFIAALAIGFFYDMLYSPWLGRMTIIFILATFSVMIVRKFVYKENMIVLTGYFFLTTYLLENIKVLLEIGPGVFLNKIIFIQGTVLATAVYAAALAAVFSMVFYLRLLLKDRKLGARKSRPI